MSADGGLHDAVTAAWTSPAVAARVARALLLPAAGAYAAVIAARNAAYDRGWLPATRVPAHVVSVGNLTVGGSGKTPLTLWIAEQLQARGHRVAIVARGYRKRLRGVVVVSAGHGPLVSAADGGDEAVMLAHRFAGPVVTAERRAEGAAHACTALGCDTIVLDDGFQHRALRRDVDVAVVADDPAAAHLLPAGSRREPWSALQRAQLVVAMDGAAVPVPGHPVVRAATQPLALVTAHADGWEASPLAALAGAEVVAVAGVARPGRFVATLEALGARVVATLAFPDHHAYGPADLAAIGAVAARGRLVTTEKDLVKLGGAGLPGLCALRIGVAVADPAALLARLAPSASGSVAFPPV
ncbi:MAG: tetraacyldisaccharide 4'-kinase [bacterium]|nr:tetraacyldisaccharide 4'-kinase [bacterium]